MPSKKSNSKQARIQKIALRKLRDLGLYTGDLRKKPTKAALKTIHQFDDVLKGRAVVLQPKNPKGFKGVFTVKGKNVIVPKRKGEKISLDKKTGEIVSKRKAGDRVITTRGLHVKRGEKIAKPETPKQYAIPFRKKGGGVFWHRFPSFDALRSFMMSYDYKDWNDYVVEETLGKKLTNAELEKRVAKQLGHKLDKGIKRKHRTRKASRAIRRSEGE